MAAPAHRFLRHLRRIVGAAAAGPASDSALLDHFVRGRDEDAFAALVARHGPMVRGVCRRVLHDTQHAGDAFQAAFLVLARKTASFAARRPGRLASRRGPPDRLERPPGRRALLPPTGGNGTRGSRSQGKAGHPPQVRRHERVLS
jgi:hypothetical protein